MQARASRTRLADINLRSASAFACFLATLSFSACGGAEGDEVPAVGQPAISLPAELPDGQRDVFADGVIDVSEYQVSFERFRSCADDAGYPLPIVEHDDVTGVITFGVLPVNGSNSPLGTPSRPVTDNPVGLCYHQYFDWVALVFETSNPSVVSQSEAEAVSDFETNAVPCLEANGYTVPSTLPAVSSAAFSKLLELYTSLHEGGKC